jgi:hypothetical protein
MHSLQISWILNQNHQVKNRFKPYGFMSYVQLANILDIEPKVSGGNNLKPYGLMSFAQFSNIQDID